MKWGAAPKTLKAIYMTLNRSVMEYAVPISSYPSFSSLEKLNNVQVGASKIISRVVSSTNNLKIQQECRLDLKTIADC